MHYLAAQANFHYVARVGQKNRRFLYSVHLFNQNVLLSRPQIITLSAWLERSQVVINGRLSVLLS